MSRLCLFDFDGTLFRSPHPPATWTEDWWNNPDSLDPPCVPEVPGLEWWIPSTISAARQAISDPDTLAVVATGRIVKSGHRYRIPELLKSAGLRFDHVFLCDGNDVAAFKSRIITDLIGRHSHIDEFAVWDDRANHLDRYATVARACGIDSDRIERNHVRARVMDAQCEPSASDVAERFRSKKRDRPAYLAIFLDSRSRATLTHEFPPIHDKIEGDHVTLALKPSPELVELYDGQRANVTVVGYAVDDFVEAVAVEHEDSDLASLKGDNSFPHVTLSVAKGTNPSESNRLLAQGFEPVSRIVLSGVIGTGPR